MMTKSRTGGLVIRGASWITVLSMFFQPVAVWAGTKNWDGGGGDVNWNTAVNWDGPDTLPANDFSGAGDVATFNQASYTRQPTINVAWGILGLSFGASSGAITITAGNTLTIGGSGIVVASGGPAHTINSAIKLGASQNWDNNDDSLLTVSGNISNTGDTTPYTLTFGGNSTGGITLSGIISNGGTTGTIALTVNTTSTGITTLSSASSTYSGGTTLSGGVLKISNNSTPTIGPFYTGGTGPLGTGLFTINGASTVTTDAARTIANDLAINTSGTVNFSPTTGPLTINGVNQSIAGGPTLNFTVTTTFGAYAMALNSDATIGTGTGAATFAGGITTGGSGTRTVNTTNGGTVTINGPFTLNNDLTFTGSHAGALTPNVTETIVPVGGRTLTFSDTGAGATTYTTGPLLLGGDFTLTGNATKKPTVTINGLRVASGAASTFILENNASNITLVLGSGANNEWILGNTLSLTLSSASTAQTIAATFVGSGGLTLNNGTVTLSANSPLYTGTINIGNSATAATLTATGTPPIFANVVFSNSGTQTLNLTTAGSQIGSLTGGANAIVSGGQLLTVGNTADTIYSGQINTAGTGLTKICSGKLTLNGSGTYAGTGATKVYAGTLALDLTNLSTHRPKYTNVLYCCFV